MRSMRVVHLFKTSRDIEIFLIFQNGNDTIYGRYSYRK